MLFQAEGTVFLFNKPGRISKEISLDKITGIDCYYGNHINLKQFIVGIILTFLGIWIAVQAHKFYDTFGVILDYVDHSSGFSGATFLYLMLILAGVICVLTCYKYSFKMSVYASECSPSPIVLGQGATSPHGNAVLYSVVSAPTEDTNRMMNELGALVKDMQNMGDLAISKWKS